MRRSLRSLLFLLLAVSLLTIPAFADMGPKSQLIVRVENTPEGLYYLDLLAEGPAADLHNYLFDEELAELDPVLLESLIAAVPNGWHACVAQGVKGAPIFGHLTAQEPGIHHFSYHGVPWTYRILMVSQSGEVFLSDVQERTVLQSSVTVDWAAGTISTPPTWVGYLLQFAATFLPTLFLEALILVFMGLTQERRNWIPFLLVNFITQGALAAWCSVTFMREGFGIMFMLLFVPAEVIITLVETLVYRRFLTHRSRSRVVVYGIAANIASAVLGWFLSEPVWRFVVSIC